MRELNLRYVQTLLDEENIVRLNAKAKEAQMTRSELIAQIVEAYLGLDESKQ